ncbi:uncharacterized protein LOC110972293 [Acanthochromis polyacanthus]|uniref:uncharacterized protein LOC110972293 n=1 Tax=Acanthochromis polyacanthus TaxID=80966 RepID=UPI00223432D7|nr:uncharacterized protein LOC110972293 [Acanthochromis polyacanthus]
MAYGKLRQSAASSILVFYIAVILTQMYSCRGSEPEICPGVAWRRISIKKNVLYSNRTSVFTDELKHGNISLKLSSVKLSDQGTYRCFVVELGRDSRIQLVVGAASSLVNISEISRNSSAVELECESAGWYPEPEVLWLDGEGNLLSAGPTETVRGPDGLYAVSSRVTVEKRHSNKLTCRVQQNNIKQSRETWIHVPDYVFTNLPCPSSSSSLSSSSLVAATIGLIVGIMLTLGVVVCVWKWRQIKLKKMQHQKTNSSGGNGALTESLIERKAAENVDRNPSSERTGSNIQIEDETHRSQTNNHLTQTQEETEKQSAAVRENTSSVMDEERQQEQLTEVRNMENNLQAEEGEKNLQEVQSNLNKEMEKLKSKLQPKERKERECERLATRLMVNKTKQEEQIKDLKKQLEDVERKLQLKKEKEETQTEEDEKDLERKKEELQKHLDRLEKALEKSIKEADVMIQRKMKAAKEKEEIINRLEMNRSENQSESDEDL